MIVEILILFIAVYLLNLWINRKPENLPPGEWGLPVVGYLPFMDRKMTKTFEKLQKKYGKIFTSCIFGGSTMANKQKIDIFDVNDKEVKVFAKNVNDNIEDMEGPLSLLGFFPWMVPLVPKYVKDKWMHETRIEEKREEVMDFLRKFIKEHRESLDKKNPRNYIDKYLIECDEQKGNSEYDYWGEEDLLSNILDFFMAGSETTSSTIRWFFLYMSRFPDVQKRVQKEIDEIVPKGQLPSLHDKEKSINFLGSVVITNIETCHKNPLHWKHPNTFSIDNFLDDEGELIKNKEGYLPFSLGRRQCLGESLAKMELFIFIGAILQNFEILEPKGQNVKLEPLEHTNIINLVPNFKVILQNRI
ncbi:Cytochrome P450 2B4 [Armadillidium nasatum]|uniref:Cytochrome P450 2B4 n=1 Tax=Armadillidium nasatum TaxID=96803 RepID=A0A5N5T7P6_9CRUS|nr:Cytochrome P450 2B4 [Armadillidium nasatum]